MTIDWNAFTPWTALSGGLILGLAATLLILANGRILGISGILGGLLPPKSGDSAWRLSFMAGLLVAPILFYHLAPSGLNEAPTVQASSGAIVIAGVLVGFGTRLGSGCTSGHGVCGLSRFSLRSLIATLTFMAAGFLTVFIIRHVIEVQV